MSEAAQNLLQILDLEAIETNLFRARNEHARMGRLFGGQVLAQCLRAAANTVPDRAPHSLHAYFLRPGDPAVPILCEVERIRDGQSFTTRRVVAIQHGRAIFNMDCSFQVSESGFCHEDPMPNVPLPESLEDDRVLAERSADKNSFWGFMARFERPFETRSIYQQGQPRPEREKFWNPTWIRFRDKVPADDLAMQHCLLAYASDMGLVSASLMPHLGGTQRSQLQTASLDHALWFHRPFNVEEWILFVRRTSTAVGSRGMNHAEFFDREGNLIASASQEGLMRQIDPSRKADKGAKKGAQRAEQEQSGE